MTLCLVLKASGFQISSFFVRLRLFLQLCGQECCVSILHALLHLRSFLQLLHVSSPSLCVVTIPQSPSLRLHRQSCWKHYHFSFHSFFFIPHSSVYPFSSLFLCLFFSLHSLTFSDLHPRLPLFSAS